jgi:photosystem II stability/assembly factor-like uncharacterized protein
VGTNRQPEGFWDALVFSDDRNGYLLGDPVNGSFLLLRTEDGGLHWRAVSSKGLSTGGQKLGVFAASNQAMVLTGPALGSVWVPLFGTSGAPGGSSPYVYSGGLDCGMEMARSNPGRCLSRYWSFNRVAVPMAGAGESEGVFALGVRQDKAGQIHVVAVGGDYNLPGRDDGSAAWRDPKTGRWSAASRLPHGYRSSVAWDAADSAWIAVGPNGSDVSYDDGQTWSSLGDEAYNALSLPWAVGPGGHIAKLTALRR